MILKVLDSTTNNNSRPVTPKVEKKEIEEESPVRSKRRKRDYERRRDSGCGSLESSPKSASYDALPQEDPLEALMKASDCGSQEACCSHGSKTNNESNSAAAVPPEASMLLDPTKVKTTSASAAASSYSFAAERIVNISNGGFPSGIMGNGSMLSQQYSASVHTIGYESETRIPGWCSYISNMFDFSLLKDKAFILFAFTSFLNMLAFYILYIFLPERLSTKCMENNNCVDVPRIEAVVGLSIFVGSIAVGWIGDRPWSNTLTISNGATILAGVVAFLCPSLSEEFHYVMFAMGFGVLTASYLTLRPIILVDLINLERLTSSFGLLCMFQGFAVVAGPSLAEFLIAQTGSQDSIFYLAGGVLILAGVVGIPLRCLVHKDEEDEEYDDEADFPMNSEAEMIEQVKLAQVESLM